MHVFSRNLVQGEVLFCLFYLALQVCISGCAISGKDGLSESRKDGEYVLTFEDKDGDWMLAGDVPWEMFADSCRRLRIMKGSDAIGLAPRAVEKSKNCN